MAEMPVTPEMIAAGWSIVNDGRRWPPKIGSGPGLVEVYRAMRALEPASTHQRALEALREAKRGECQTFNDAAAISAENDALRDALNDLLTRPTDPAARQRARAALTRIKEAT